MKTLLTVILAIFILTSSVQTFAAETYKHQKPTEQTQVKVLKSNFVHNIIKKAEDAASNPKNQLTALLLAIFLGTLGVHRFYLGYTMIGLIQLAVLLLSIVGFLFLFGFLTYAALLVWVIIDAVNIYTGKLKPADGSNYDPTL